MGQIRASNQWHLYVKSTSKCQVLSSWGALSLEQGSKLMAKTWISKVCSLCTPKRFPSLLTTTRLTASFQTFDIKKEKLDNWDSIVD